jgi:conjugal transfer pilus assembly protein TraD
VARRSFAPIGRLAGERARLASRRPLAPLGRRAGERARLAGARGRTEPVPGALAIGTDRAGRAVGIPFAPAAPGHTLVVGATGSGKTVTQTLLAVRAIEQGRGAVVIDPKGDGAMRRELAAAARGAGRRLIEWTPGGPSAYNPYARGSETEIADRLLAGEQFTEPHYLRQAQRYLGHAVRALRACGVEVSLRAAVETLDPATLEQLLRDAPEEPALSGQAYLDSLTPRQLRDLAGVRDRLAILAESDTGRWLDAGGSEASFDMLEAIRDRCVVYFRLDTDSRPLLAQMLGAAVVQDLQSTVAALQAAPQPTIVVIDEFAAVSAERVVALFGRARSAGLSLVLGTQEIADLRLPGRERTLEQVVGNLSVLIAHRQVVPASAELVSRLSGKRGAWRVSRSSAGRTTRTREQQTRLAPELLSELATGWAAVLRLGAPNATVIARIAPLGGERR